MSIQHHRLIQAEELRSQVFSSLGEGISALPPDKPVQRERWGLGSSGAVSSFWNRNSVRRIEQLFCRGPGGAKNPQEHSVQESGSLKSQSSCGLFYLAITHKGGHHLLATSEIHRKLTMLFGIANTGLSDTLHGASWVLRRLWNFQCVAS